MSLLTRKIRILSKTLLSPCLIPKQHQWRRRPTPARLKQQLRRRRKRKKLDYINFPLERRLRRCHRQIRQQWLPSSCLIRILFTYHHKNGSLTLCDHGVHQWENSLWEWLRECLAIDIRTRLLLHWESADRWDQHGHTKRDVQEKRRGSCRGKEPWIEYASTVY